LSHFDAAGSLIANVCCPPLFRVRDAKLTSFVSDGKPQKPATIAMHNPRSVSGWKDD